MTMHSVTTILPGQVIITMTSVVFSTLSRTRSPVSSSFHLNRGDGIYLEARKSVVIARFLRRTRSTSCSLQNSEVRSSSDAHDRGDQRERCVLSRAWRWHVSSVVDLIVAIFVTSMRSCPVSRLQLTTSWPFSVIVYQDPYPSFTGHRKPSGPSQLSLLFGRVVNPAGGQ
ncbi:unnamed protein product [Cylicocyclus nassatus]|uniref:Uncharacterized protein n=1 Tax=Cylicocyclus nassatus TaxID=53992 RepID=A0AA36GII0_CYLNA|nr:unnamed protein product [Cylicocyclus nassatus]